MYFPRQNLVFLAIPKTGTTAIKRALAPHAGLAATNPPALRHMSLAEYRQHLEPMLARRGKCPPEIFTVVREPVARLLSWYRYRQRNSPTLQAGHSTIGISPEEFLEETLRPEPRPFARIGSQDRFIGRVQGLAPPEHLFPYEHSGPLAAFLGARFGPTEIERVNVSPSPAPEVSPELAARVRAHRAQEVALYHDVLRTHDLAPREPCRNLAGPCRSGP